MGTNEMGNIIGGRASVSCGPSQLDDVQDGKDDVAIDHRRSGTAAASALPGLVEYFRAFSARYSGHSQVSWRFLLFTRESPRCLVQFIVLAV